MNGYNKNYNYGSYVTQEVSSAFPALMRNVYVWMCAGLSMTALTAMVVARSPEMMTMLLQNSMMLFVLMAIELGLVIYLSARIHKMSFITAGISFAAYAILNGVTMSFIFLAYTMESIASTFAITAGTFGAMALVGTFIKKDLSGMGRILMMALIGLIIATIVNIFMASSGFAMILNYAGVIIFTGLTAYDTQKIKEMMLQASQMGLNDQTQKLALMGSLSLYLDFINLFLYLLRIFGSRND